MSVRNATPIFYVALTQILSACMGTPQHIMASNCPLAVKSHTGFLYHRECMEEEYENANGFVKTISPYNLREYYNLT